MIRVEVIEQFTLKDYENIKDSIKRKSIDVKGTLFIGDTFECDEKMVDYLTGNNPLNKVVVKVIEVKPKMPTIIGHRVDDVEYVVPLGNKEKLDKLNKTIEKEIKPKKKKTSKK